MDEPTNGLDPRGIKEIRELILDLNEKKGITFLISTHILSEIQQIATKIGIIDKGVLIEEINYDELQKRNRHYINLKVSDDRKASFILENKLNINYYEIWERNVIRIYENLEQVSDVNKVMVANDIEVKEICIKLDSLEDYFLKLVEKSKVNNFKISNGKR